MAEIVTILFAIYLLVGFFFTKPKEWSLPVKIIVHIFWLPLVLVIVATLYFGLKERKRKSKITEVFFNDRR